jgi:hypothetical protein
MLSIKNMLESIATRVLISGVYDKTLINMKQMMENHVQVEEANMTRWGHHHF